MKIQSWKAIWCAASGASPIRVDDHAGEDERGDQRDRADEDELAEREQAPREVDAQARVGETDPPQDRDDHRRPHRRLRDHRAPRRSLDAEIEAVDEHHLEDHVDDVARDHDHERRAQVGDAAKEALAADREERGRNAERHDPQVGDGVVRRRPLGPEEVDDRLCEQRDGDREGAAEGEREPEALRPEPRRGQVLARSGRSRHLGRRPVLEEVEHREHGEHGRREAERRELGAAEMADDGGVDEDVERLSGERPESRDREAQDLAVVR